MVYKETVLPLDNVTSLDQTEKKVYVGYTMMIYQDEKLKTKKSPVKNVPLYEQDGWAYKLTARNLENNTTKTAADKVKECGLSDSASKKVLNKVEKKEARQYQIDDIKKVSSILENLTPKNQEKAIELVLENRKEFHQVNKEDVVIIALGEGFSNSYYIDLLYGGLVRAIERLMSKLSLDPAVYKQLDPVQKKNLKKLLGQLKKKLQVFEENL